MRLDAVWDIECANWDTFAVGAIWTHDTGTIVHRTEDDMARALLALPPGANAWAHAGGRYDVLWLLDWCRRNGVIPEAQIRLSGSSIASLAIKGGPILRDSYRLIPLALRDACAMFGGTRKQDLDVGYDVISPDMTGAVRRAVEEYLVADVEALRDTLRSLASYADTHGIILGGTVASSAWKTAKATCGLPDTDWIYRAYKVARSGYYGGRCEVGKTRAAKVWRYDRASAYPAALRKPVPIGVSRVLVERTARLCWDKGRPGIYRATVDIPESHTPPLPVRLKQRIVFPWGRVTGSWERDELLHAVECGAKIVRLHGGIAWAEEAPILRPHVERCFDLRAKADNKPLKTWLKFLANSLTGAFAQDPVRDMIVLGDYSDDPEYEQVGRYSWIWRRNIFSISDRAHVQWSAVLTADARVELHRQILHAGDDWVYSDTDSVFATRPLERGLGDDLGAWQFEGAADDFEAIAPKVYSYVGKDGRHARAKGIPGARDAWERIRAGETVSMDRGVKSLLVASRGNALFERQDAKRRVTCDVEWIGGRVRDGDGTRAPHVSELSALR